MIVAEYIADQLNKHAIRYVFGIPGGASIPYMEALRSVGIEFILTSNEAASGIMADVSARLTGIPGVCHSTYGPGATNLATGAGGALLDRSPVIVLTSEMDDAMLSRTTQMNINHQKLFEPLTKATFRMTSENAVEVLDKALRLCREEYPGPVHIGLPSDLALKKIHMTHPAEPSTRNRISGNDVNRVISLLKNSRKPVLAAGLTSARFNIGKQLLEFLEIHKMPVLLTPMAKGIIPENHPCYAGVLFHALSNYLEGVIDKADLVIGLGYDPVEFNYESWMPDVPLIHFDTTKTDMPASVNCIQYIAAPEDWFTILNKPHLTTTHGNLSDIPSLRKEMTSVFRGLTDHFGPVTAIKVLQEELPADVILTSDVGSHLHLIGQYWETHGRKNLIISNGWSGMGFGIPAALAAQIVNPDLNVTCVTGDGGFLMMAGEIITARRYNLPVIFVVFSDGELNLIRLKKTWKKLTPSGTQLYSGDLFGSDTFFGVKVFSVDTESAMRIAIKKSILPREPVIINARIDPLDYNQLVVKR
jgi:acetolactate synthase-1/2/3 large subunit